jgi:hypothetical protein
MLKNERRGGMQEFKEASAILDVCGKSKYSSHKQ